MSQPTAPHTARVAVNDNAIKVPKHWMEFGSVDRLSRFTQYKFFSIALPYLFGRFTDRPLGEFLVEYGKPCHFMHHRFRRPLFRGMATPAGNGDWNRVLWAIELEAWPHFENFFLSLAINDAGAGRVYRYGSQDIRIADPLWADSNGVLLSADAPTVDIVVFGVDATHGVAAVDAGADPQAVFAAGGPAVKFHPPQPRTVAFAKAMVGEENPQHSMDLKPVSLKQVDLRTMSPKEQEEYRQAIAEYQKEIQG